MFILIATVMIVVIGIIVGAGLVYTGKKFYVPVDEREAAVRECLPGNNCGACGYAGCDAMAAAIAAGEAPVNGCPVGGNPAAEKIAAIMGTEAGEVERNVAFVRDDPDDVLYKDGMWAEVTFTAHFEPDVYIVKYDSGYTGGNVNNHMVNEQ